MEAPGFWDNPPDRPGLLAHLLAPAAWAWGLGARLRAAQKPERAGVPVICIGNLTAGGAGKTPMVAEVVSRLSALGARPMVLSRGHGGRLRGPHRVDPARDSAADVGDEPLLLAAFAPVWIARDRAAGARAAVADGASVIVMDDGFQNPALVKDLSVLMVDAGQGFGNGRLIPAGPLREPVAAGLARADLVVLVGADPARAAAIARWPQLGPALPARISPLATGLDLSGMAVVAFAGIGRPGKFFDTLKAMGARLVAAEAFPDHHVYAPQVLVRLKRTAAGQNAMLVTTEKDAVRLPPDWRREVMVLPIRMELEDPAPLQAALSRIVAESPRSGRNSTESPGQSRPCP